MQETPWPGVDEADPSLSLSSPPFVCAGSSWLQHLTCVPAAPLPPREDGAAAPTHTQSPRSSIDFSRSSSCDVLSCFLSNPSVQALPLLHTEHSIHATPPLIRPPIRRRNRVVRKVPMMEYSAIANARVRQEARRCFKTYHEAFQSRRQHSPTVTPAAAAAAAPSSLPPRTPANVISGGPCFQFYRGELPARPGKELVDDLLAWGGEAAQSSPAASPTWDADQLERRHDYIQWCFPLRERGVNWQAPLLTSAEAAQMQADGLVMARVLQAFRMMLRFYGTHVTYRAASPRRSGGPEAPVTLTATLQRTPDVTEWRVQYDNLLCRSHNCLRISRMLQFAGEVGLESLKLGWLEYLAREVMAPHAPLRGGACRDSFFFWMETPYEASDRHRLQRLVEELVAAGASGDASATVGPVVDTQPFTLPASLDMARVLAAAPGATTEEATPLKRRRL